jgi:hypothetical protein
LESTTGGTLVEAASAHIDASTARAASHNLRWVGITTDFTAVTLLRSYEGRSS